MPLTLLLGPANCGKVAQLIDRFAEQIDAGAAPTLVVPTRPDVELAERDLLVRRSAVLGGMIGTFEDLFERVLERSGEPSAALATLPRRLVGPRRGRTVVSRRSPRARLGVSGW